MPRKYQKFLCAIFFYISEILHLQICDLIILLLSFLTLKSEAFQMHSGISENHNTQLLPTMSEGTIAHSSKSLFVFHS